MKIIILGGGAAGFMAAITAAETNPKNEVILLEKSPKTLQKVRISGGGRCNVTHRPHDAKNFSRNYPRGGVFLRKLFSVFDANDTVRWFESRGIKLTTESDGRMFPVTNSSETIVHCLMETARTAGVVIHTQTIHPKLSSLLHWKRYPAKQLMLTVS
jgi:predicted Rossmann fold flavoprotein